MGSCGWGKPANSVYTFLAYLNSTPSEFNNTLDRLATILCPLFTFLFFFFSLINVSSIPNHPYVFDQHLSWLVEEGCEMTFWDQDTNKSKDIAYKSEILLNHRFFFFPKQFAYNPGIVFLISGKSILHWLLVFATFYIDWLCCILNVFVSRLVGL